MVKYMSKLGVVIYENAMRLAKVRGWSKNDFAEKLGSNVKSLNNIKTGARGVGPDLLSRMASILGVEESDLALEEMTLNHTSDGGEAEHEVIPKIVRDLFASDDEALKTMVVDYITTIQTKKRLIDQEREYVRGATDQGKWPGQVEPNATTDDLGEEKKVV